jgi:5-deoxy-glucuronate isomerase
MPSPLIIKGRGFHPGYTQIAAPEETALRWITVGRLGLLDSTAYEGVTGEQELVATLLSGTVTLEVDGQTPRQVARQADMFASGPSYICLPPQTSYRLATASPMAELFLFHAPTDAGAGVHIIRPEDAPSRVIGASNWARTVWPGTGAGATTTRLLVGETINPPGNWSSYPPHKHDTDDPPREMLMEEVYVFAVKPAGGFGIQRIYERRAGPDALDETIVVEDGDTVIIPRGYHPVVAAPGYQLGYVWALCGHGRVYGAWSDDPAYAWLHAVVPIIAAQ